MRCRTTAPSGAGPTPAEPGWPRHGTTPSWEHEAAEHRAVLRAAENGDAERAAGLLRHHITSFVARNFPEPQENQEA